MHPMHLAISDFSYHLPSDRIAVHPLAERDASRLLIYKQGVISSHSFTELPGLLPKQALLVFNNSKVIESRLLFEKETGGVIEVFLLEPHDDCGPFAQALTMQGRVRFHCMIGGASKWKHGMKLTKRVVVQQQPVVLQADLVERSADGCTVEFVWQPAQIGFLELLHQAGNMPIPPYLHRPAEEVDRERYQTIYAAREGSVAAPTAGLHFTPRIMEALAREDINTLELTLHVGAGTFKPVKAATMAGHFMHAELTEISRSLLEKLLQPAFIIPVGTTSMRTLESIYWMGIKAILNTRSTLADLQVKQWDPYEDNFKRVGCSFPEAVEALLHWMTTREMDSMATKTQLMIAPGYRFAACNGLVTNFHQPQSTLLLLVAALVGDDWKKVYDYALENGFRFLSYGDCSLLLP